MSEQDQGQTIPQMPPYTAIWVRLPTVEGSHNIWLWKGAQEVPPTATPAAMAGFRREGLQLIDPPDVIATLMLGGRMARMRQVLRPDATTPEYWVDASELALFRKQPVTLGFPINEEAYGCTPETQYLPILQYWPHPQFGEYGVVRVEEAWRYYPISLLGKAGKALQQRLVKAIKALVEPAFWWKWHPMMQRLLEDYDGVKQSVMALHPANERERKEMQQGIAKLDTFVQQLQTHRAMVEHNKQRREATKALRTEVRDLSQELLALYWKAHLTKLQEEQHPDVPQPFRVAADGSGYAYAPLNMIIAGAHASIYHKQDWEKEHMVEQGVQQGMMVRRYLFTHGKGETRGETEYWMEHPEDAEVPLDPDLASQEVLSHLQILNDRNADIFTLAPTYVLANGLKLTTITPEQIRKDLGLKPKSKDGYAAGERADDLRSVVAAFEQAAWFRFKTQQWIQQKKGRPPKLVTAKEPYLIIRETVTQQALDGTGPEQVLFWRFEMPWLNKFMGDTEAGRQFGVLLKKSLEYGLDQPWEKRLSRYFTIHLCVAAHHRQKGIDCIIIHVLRDVGLVPSDRDRARPGEFADHFERVMNRLKADGIIGDWLPKTDRNSLPARNWFDTWLGSGFHITQAPAALAAGYQKMIEKGQKLAEPGTPTP
jgi:hypothetical protein